MKIDTTCLDRVVTDDNDDVFAVLVGWARE